MKIRVLGVLIATIVGLASPDAAAEGRGMPQCHGGILPEGAGIQFCFPTLLYDGWQLRHSEVGSAGLMVAEFVIEQGECRPDPEGGDCIWHNHDQLRIYLYDAEPQESIRVAVRRLKVYLGFRRAKKIGKGYFLNHRRGQNKGRALVFPWALDKRFLVVVYSKKKMSRSASGAYLEFLTGLEVYYSCRQ